MFGKEEHLWLSVRNPYWQRKICPESGQKHWLVNGVEHSGKEQGETAVFAG